MSFLCLFLPRRLVDIMECREKGINIGYCPQVDALDNLLTGEELLYFYGRIRGISKRELDGVRKSYRLRWSSKLLVVTAPSTKWHGIWYKIQRCTPTAGLATVGAPMHIESERVKCWVMWAESCTIWGKMEKLLLSACAIQTSELSQCCTLDCIKIYI